MIKLSKEDIKEIADQLDMGFCVFLHKETHEMIFVPDMDQFSEMDPEGWEEEFSKLKKGRKKYVEIERMDSNDFYHIMIDFANQVTDTSIRNTLLEALERKKPFRNFKGVVDNSGDYREEWFAFKNRRNIEWVEDQLKYLSEESQ